MARHWDHDGAHVLVREVPCSGKTDLQYLLGAFEGGGRGVCVVACPRGECRLAEGNYRAEVRIGTLKRLLAEIGIEPERAELVHCSPHEPFDRFEQLVRDAVGRICALGESPVREKGTGPFCRNGPEGASHKRVLSPFPESEGQR